MTEPVRYDLYGPAFKANPYPTYATMREQEPVCYHLGLDGEHEIWFITRYADAEAVLRDHKRFVKNYRTTLTPEQRQQLPPDPQLIRMLDQHMLNADGADHTRLRGLINKAFTAQMINRMQSRVQAIADSLIDRVQEQGAMNLIDDYAFPLPIVVIAELLGVPASDQDRFRVWSDAFLTPSFTPEGWAKTEQLMLAFTGYLGQVFAARRAQPKDDLISALIQAEEAGEKLSEEEISNDKLELIDDGLKLYMSIVDLNSDSEIKEKWSGSENSKKVQMTIAFSAIISWKKGIDIVQINIESPYKEQGIPNELSDIIPFNTEKKRT